MHEHNSPPDNNGQEKVANLGELNTDFEFGKFGIGVKEIINEANQTIKQGNEANESASDKILDKYSYLQITEDTSIPAPIPVIKINDEIISTEGNITTISGPSKSGKSAFTGVIIAGAIAPSDYDYKKK